MVQEFVDGREFYVGFLGKHVLPLSEISFETLSPRYWRIVSYAAKWTEGSPEYQGHRTGHARAGRTAPGRQDHRAWRAGPGKRSAVRDTAGSICGWTPRRPALRARGESRIRISRPTPAMPAWRALRGGTTTRWSRTWCGRPWIAPVARTRPATCCGRSPHDRAAGRVTIRPLDPADRARVEAMTRAVGLFREEEIPVAVEVFEATAARERHLRRTRGAPATATWSAGSPGDRLRALSAPSTSTGSWSIPSHHGQGIGSVLVDEMERLIAGSGQAHRGRDRGQTGLRGDARVLSEAGLRSDLGDPGLLRSGGRQGDLRETGRLGG